MISFNSFLSKKNRVSYLHNHSISHGDNGDLGLIVCDRGVCFCFFIIRFFWMEDRAFRCMGDLGFFAVFFDIHLLWVTYVFFHNAQDSILKTTDRVKIPYVMLKDSFRLKISKVLIRSDFSSYSYSRKVHIKQSKKGGLSMAKYGKKAQESVHRAMHKYKGGQLHSGKGKAAVKNRKQAIAIGLSKARKKGAKVPKKAAK